MEVTCLTVHPHRSLHLGWTGNSSQTGAMMAHSKWQKPSCWHCPRCPSSKMQGPVIVQKPSWLLVRSLIERGRVVGADPGVGAPWADLRQPTTDPQPTYGRPTARPTARDP